MDPRELKKKQGTGAVVEAALAVVGAASITSMAVDRLGLPSPSPGAFAVAGALAAGVLALSLTRPARRRPEPGSPREHGVDRDAVDRCAALLSAARAWARAERRRSAAASRLRSATRPWRWVLHPGQDERDESEVARLWSEARASLSEADAREADACREMRARARALPCEPAHDALAAAELESSCR